MGRAMREWRQFRFVTDDLQLTGAWCWATEAGQVVGYSKLGWWRFRMMDLADGPDEEDVRQLGYQPWVLNGEGFNLLYLPMGVTLTVTGVDRIDPVQPKRGPHDAVDIYGARPMVPRMPRWQLPKEGVQLLQHEFNQGRKSQTQADKIPFELNALVNKAFDDNFYMILQDWLVEERGFETLEPVRFNRWIAQLKRRGYSSKEIMLVPDCGDYDLAMVESTIVTPRFSRDVEELRTWDMNVSMPSSVMSPGIVGRASSNEET